MLRKFSPLRRRDTGVEEEENENDARKASTTEQATPEKGPEEEPRSWGRSFFRLRNSTTERSIFSKASARTDTTSANEYEAKIEILQAEGLRIADKKRQSSDPFVEISLGGKKRRTTTKYRTLEPRWNEDFMFGTSAKRRLHGDECVIFNLLDKDPVFNDELGACYLDLTDVLVSPGQTLSTWLTLRPYEIIRAECATASPKKRSGSTSSKQRTSSQAKDKIPGRLEVRVTLFDIDNSVSKHKDITDNNDGKTVQAGRNIAHEDKEAKNSEDEDEEDEAGNEDTDEDSDHLKEDIDDDDDDDETNTTSNDLKTRTQSGQESAATAASSSSRGRSMSKTSTNSQKLHIDTQAEETPLNGCLRVSIKRAKGLKAADGNKSSDPYCTVRFGRKEFSTKKLTKTLDPEWNETFEFTVSNNSKRKPLVFKVYDNDFLRDDYLGKLSFSFENALSMGSIARDQGKALPEWHELDDGKGELEIIVEHVKELDNVAVEEEANARDTYKGKGILGGLRALSPRNLTRRLLEPPSTKSVATADVTSEAGEAVTSIQSQHSEMGLDPVPSELQLKVVCAKGLRSADRNGSSDPFCIVRINRERFKTRKLSRTLEPEWNETFNFKRSKHWTWDTMLSFVVSDADFLGTSDFLGETEVSLYELYQAQGSSMWLELTERGGKPAKNSRELGSIQISAAFPKTDDLPESRSNDKASRESSQQASRSTYQQHVSDASSQFDHVILEIQKQLKADNTTYSKLSTSFQLYDHDNSGYIERDELHELFDSFNLTVNLEPEQVDVLLGVLDENKDGKVDIKEINALLRDLNTQAASVINNEDSEIPHSVDEVLLRLITSTIERRQRIDGNVPPDELVEEFVHELQKQFEALDDRGQGYVSGKLKFNYVLRKAKGSSIEKDSDFACIVKAFGSAPQSGSSKESIDYHAFCEAILELHLKPNSQLAPWKELTTRSKEENLSGAVSGKGLPHSLEERRNSKISVQIMRAEIFPTSHRPSTGQAKPFVVVTVGSEARTTEVAKRNLHPVWEETFLFPGPSSKNSSLANLDPDDTILLQIKEKSLLLSETLAELQIPIRDVSWNNDVSAWYEFKIPKSKSKQISSAKVKLLVSIEGLQHDLGQNSLGSESIGQQSPPLSRVDDYKEGMEFSSLASDGLSEPLESPRSGYGSDNSITSDHARWHDRQLREIRQLVARGMRDSSRKTSIRAELERLDVRHKGYLSSRRLIAGLAAFGIHMNPSQLAVILPRIDPEGRDRVNYGLFCKIVRADGASSSQRESSASVEGTRARLKQVIVRAHSRKTNFPGLFLAFDSGHSGLISQTDCSSALKALEGNFDPSELLMLAQRLPDTEQNGYIVYEKLFAAVCPAIDIHELFLDAKSTTVVNKAGQGTLSTSIQSSLAKLKRISRLLAESQSQFDFARTLERLDSSGDGKISRRDFRNFLASELVLPSNVGLGESMSEADIHVLVQYFDPRSLGTIDYMEVYRSCAMTKDELDTVMERFREALKLQHRRREQNGSPSLLVEFSRLDLDGSGRISRREFRTVLEAFSSDLAMKLSSEELRYLMDKFDQNCTGSVAYHDFVDYVHDGAHAMHMLANKDSRGEVDLYQVDRLMRSELGPPKYLASNKLTQLFTPRGLIDESLSAADGTVQRGHSDEVDLWHPHTISEWLDRHATAAERRDFDEIYRSISRFENRSVGSSIGIHSSDIPSASPRREMSRSPVRGSIYAAGALHETPRSPSPMDRSSSRVGWKCPSCKHVNSGLQSLNTCSRCGAIRTSSSKVVILYSDSEDEGDYEDEDEGDDDDRSESDSDSEDSYVSKSRHRSRSRSSSRKLQKKGKHVRTRESVQRGRSPRRRVSSVNKKSSRSCSRKSKRRSMKSVEPSDDDSPSNSGGDSSSESEGDNWGTSLGMPRTFDAGFWQAANQRRLENLAKEDRERKKLERRELKHRRKEEKRIEKKAVKKAKQDTKKNERRRSHSRKRRSSSRRRKYRSRSKHSSGRR